MRELAKRGGAATKRRAAADPRYYSAIGRMGGLASVKARRDRSAAILADEAPPQAPPDTSEAAGNLEPLEDRVAVAEAAASEPPRWRNEAEREAYMEGYREMRRRLGLGD